MSQSGFVAVDWPKKFMIWGDNPLIEDNEDKIPSHHLAIFNDVSNFDFLLGVLEKKERSGEFKLGSRERFINGLDAYSNTPLHIATSFGHIEMSGYLLSKGANINSINRDGHSPLHTILQRIKDGAVLKPYIDLALNMITKFSLIATRFENSNKEPVKSVFEIITSEEPFTKFPLSGYLGGHPKIIEERVRRRAEERVASEKKIQEIARQVEEAERLRFAKEEEARVVRDAEDKRRAEELMLVEKRRIEAELEAMSVQDINITDWEEEVYITDEKEKFDVRSYIKNRDKDRETESANRLEMAQEDVFSAKREEIDAQFLQEARDLEIWRKAEERARREEFLREAKELELKASAKKRRLREEEKKREAAIRRERETAKKEQDDRLLEEAMKLAEKERFLGGPKIEAIERLRVLLLEESFDLGMIGEFVSEEFGGTSQTPCQIPHLG